MCLDTHWRDAASILFNLAGYRVVSAWHGEEGQRVVLIESSAAEDGVPLLWGDVQRGCVRVRFQQVKEVTCGGELVVVRVRKRRYVCTEARCPRGTFAGVTEQLPARARLITRLPTQTLDVEGHVDSRLVRRSGIDEHRFRRMCNVRDVDTGAREKAVRATRLAVPRRLFQTLSAWRRELMTFWALPVLECVDPGRQLAGVQ